MSAGTTILYHPVAPQELSLIADSGYRRFPPRLPEQPIFYPVSDSYWTGGGDGTGMNRLGKLLL